LYYSETEKPTLIFMVIVFKISRKTYSHRCQCKQNAQKLLPDHNSTVSLNGRIVVVDVLIVWQLYIFYLAVKIV